MGPLVQHPRLESHQALRQLREITVGASPVTWARTMSRNPAGGYYGFGLQLRSPPWWISTAPLETFAIYEVVPSEDG